MESNQRTMRDFVAFRFMMTPMFIQAIWIVGSLVIAIGGLISAAFAGRGFVGFLIAVGILAVSLVLWRVYCELLILLFRIHDAIVETKGGGQAPPTQPDEAA